jgi:uncharacterized membrane protein YkvA (DUF1232 family)
MPNYARLCWALARDPRLSRARRAALLAAAAYVVSPVDLVPGFIPVLGQLDDLAIALGAIRLALDGLHPEVRAERLHAAGLTHADFEADLRATGAITLWLTRTGLHVGAEAASMVFHGAQSLARNLLAARRRSH